MTMAETAASHPRPKSSWASILTVIITLVGFVGVYRQFQWYNEANEREDRRRSDETVARLYATEMDIRKFLSGYPELRQYLADDPGGAKFDELRKDKSNETLLSRVRLVCGMYANFFEYYLLIETHISHKDQDSIRKAFRNEINSVLDQSGALRWHLVQDRETWTSKLMEIRDAAEARRTAPKTK